ncbi:MAG: magnesium/cobalt transporter CorA [Opitutaceae bacterium]
MIRSFVFSEGKLASQDLAIEALRLVRADKGLILWIDLDSPTPEEIKTVLENIFEFHPLAIEDCVTPSSLPKIEDYDDYLFLVMHAVDFSRTDKFATTELDLFIGKDYLVTFHAKPLKSVQAAIERVTKGAGFLARGPDRLAHTVLDLLVDLYQPVMAALAAELEEIENSVLTQESSSKEFMAEIIKVRADFSKLRAIASPQREVIERLARGENKLIRPVMLPYFRDLRDNLARLDATGASYHERLMMTFDIFLNKAGFEANEGIKFLTALTAVTLPAVIVGGWYGMNFDNMRELHSPHGYFLATMGTLLATLLMVLYLRKRKWF